jgi:hypothetical protein
MLRTSAARSIPRSLTSFQATTQRSSALNNALRASLKTSARPARAARVLAVAAFQPGPKALVRYAHNAHTYDIAAAEKAWHSRMLTPHPDEVSASSTTRAVAGEVQPPSKTSGDDEVDMSAGIRNDFVGSCLGTGFVSEIS